MTSAAPGGGYGTETAAMQAAALHVQQVNDAIQGELRMLQAQVGSLSASWRGDAATSFTALMGRWDADATSLRQALDGIGVQLRGSGHTYEQNEAAQRGSFTTISGVLG